MKPRILRAASLILAMSAFAVFSPAQQLPKPPPAAPPAPGDAVSFSNQIAPILLAQCQTCHGHQKAKGKYRLDTLEHLMKPGGSKSPSITPGKPDESELFNLLTDPNPKVRMPQDADPLPAPQLELVRQWILQGAKYDAADPQAPLISIAPAPRHPPAPKAYPRPMAITAMAFSAKGDQLAISGYNEITLWNPREGKLLARIPDIAQRTHALAFTPDGAALVVAGGIPGELGELKSVDLKALDHPQRTYFRTTGVVFDLAFSPDGKRLAACAADSSLRIFETDTGKQLVMARKHSDWVTGLAWHPNGSRILTASRDKTVKLCDAATGDVIATYQDHRDIANDAAFSLDGKIAISAGKDNRVHFWTFGNETKRVGEVGFGGEVFRLLTDGDTLLACSADKSLRVINIPDRKQIHNFSGLSDWVFSLAHNRAQSLAAAGCHDGRVHLFDLKTGKPVTSFIAAPGYSPPTAPK